MPYINSHLIRRVIGMILKPVEFKNVVAELRNMKKKLGNGQNIAWVSFPYTKNNLEIVIKSLQHLKWPQDQCHISYDENLIFVDTDLYGGSI
jgi:hypothetical protein